jgi:anti-anti-sigma factor
MALASSSALPLRWNTSVDGSRVAAVAVAGDLDRVTAPLLHDHLLWLAATHPPAVELDLSSIVFIDVGGHDVLRRVADHYRFRAVPIGLRDPSPPVERLLGLLGWPIPRRIATTPRPEGTCRRRSGEWQAGRMSPA